MPAVKSQSASISLREGCPADPVHFLVDVMNLNSGHLASAVTVRSELLTNLGLAERTSINC